MTTIGPARTAMKATILASASYAGDALTAFWHGVELGRVEAAKRPTGLVVTLEPGMLGADVERLMMALRTMRGVAQVAKIAETPRETVPPWWVPQTGDRVRTAAKLLLAQDDLRRYPWSVAGNKRRRANALGRMSHRCNDQPIWWVTHEDGSEAPYAYDELSPMEALTDG